MTKRIYHIQTDRGEWVNIHADRHDWDSGELALFVDHEVIAVLRPKQWHFTDLDNGARDNA